MGVKAMKNTSGKYWRILLVSKILLKGFNDFDTVDYRYKTLMFKSSCEISLYFGNSNYILKKQIWKIHSLYKFYEYLQKKVWLF